MTFVIAAFLTYGMIEWFARPTEAYSPDPAATTFIAPEGMEIEGIVWSEPDTAASPLPAVGTGGEDFGLVIRPASIERPSAPETRGGGGSDLRVLSGHIESGGTLTSALLDNGIDAGTVERIATALEPVFDVRFAHPDDFFTLVRGDAGEVLSFEYNRGRRDLYRVQSVEGELRAVHEEIPLERRVVRLSGVVHQSLFETVISLGEEPELVNAFADIFAWDFDFAKETQPGDDFRIVFEKYFDRDGFVKYGHVLAAQYRSAGRTYVAIYFEDLDGDGDYYRPDGTSIRRSFLRAPLQFTRISSPYSKSRLHPILKVRRPHEGVDYAAPEGTPVWAVADGTVIFKGWDGGFGRLVKVRHENGYVSYYAHLSSYAEGIVVGARVSQKQVVGRVGATGLATGPHLDYRLKVNGRFVDPLKVELPKGRAISVRDAGRFAPVRDARLRELAVVMPAAPLSASR